MSSLKKNFIYLSAYKILEMLLPMVTSPLLSRRLGAEALGTYTYISSVVSFFVTVAELGVYRYGMREIAKVRNDRQSLNQTYSDIFSVHFLNGACIAILYYIFVFAAMNPAYKVFALIQGLMIAANMFDNAFFYVGIENVKAVSVRDALSKLVAFVLTVVLVRSPGDLTKYVVLMVASSLFCRVWGLIHATKYADFIRPNIQNCKKHYKPMIILMVPAIASIIYQSMDKVMIGAIYDIEDVGYYECASKALIPRNIISALGTVLCPRIANLYAEKKKEKVSELFSRSMSLSLILSYAFMFGIAAIAKEFAPWFWGEDFSVCAGLLVGLSISIPLWCIGEVIRNQFLLPTGRDNEYMMAFLVGVIVNAIANVILIPNHGAKGAIVATLLAEFMMSLVQMWVVRKELSCMNMIETTIPYFVMGVIMYVVVRTIAKIVQGTLLTHICTEIVAGVMVFVVLSIIYELVSGNRNILSVMKKRMR